MKLLFGAVAYLALVAAVIVAVLAGLSSIERRQPAETAAAATPVGDPAARRRPAMEDTHVDPNRVPVWIAATTKYDYTPPPIDAWPKRTPVIGAAARAAMAKARNPRKPEPSTEAAAASRGVASSRRDNDPFFRD